MTTSRPKRTGFRSHVPAPLRHRPHFSVLPAVPDYPTAGLPPSQVRYGMRMSIADGAFAQVFLSVTTGSFVTALALFLGATDFVLGLVTALPVLAQLVQLPAAWLVERRGDRRALTVWTSLGRLFWLVPVLIVFVPMPTEWRLGLALLAMALAFGLLAMSTNAWLSWMSDLIPAGLRGRFFASRSTIVALVSLGVSFAGGTLLDVSRSAGRPDLGFLALYTVACAAGLLSTYFVSRQPEPKLVRAARSNFLALLRTPWADRSFRSFIITMTIWSFGINFSAPFYGAQSLKVLHVSYQQLASFDMTLIAVSLLSQVLWGRFADRVGQRQAMRWSILGAAPLALTWLFVTPDNLWLLYLNNVVSGTFWPGFTLALNNRLMERAPAAGRASYLALYSAITGGVAFGASLLAGVLANALGDSLYPLGPLVMNHYQVIFLVAGAIRVSVALFRRHTL